VSGALVALRARLGAAGSSLHVRNYRLYFLGQSVSVAGTFMQTLAIAFLTLRLTGSGTALGVATGARLLPFLLFGPAGGVIADRYDKRRLLFFTQTASAAGSLAFAVLTAAGLMSYPLLLVLSVVLGCCTVLDNPARQSLIGELVPRKDLANAVVLNSVSLNVARVAGSVAGGTLVAAIGVPVCFLLNALSFVAVIINLARMRTGEMLRSAPAPRAPGQVREGLRYAAHTPALAIPLVMVTLTGILAYEFPTTLPLLATDAFAGTAATYGAMAAVMAGGAIVGGLVAASRSGTPRPSSLAVVAVGWGAAILAAGVAPNLATALAALAFVGYGSITFNAAAKTTLQLTARPELRGRVMALWGLAWNGGTVLGAPLVGWVAETFGSRWGLVIGGAPTIVLGVALLPALRRLGVQHPSRAGSPAEPGAPA
jgi:MFS family permease